MAGVSLIARRFPVRIGRGAGCELKVDEPGVWERHLVLAFNPATGFRLQTEPNALARVNGESVSEVVLRNGDMIELGAVRIQFWLSPVRQRRLFVQQALSWGILLGCMLGELGLLYWLLAD